MYHPLKQSKIVSVKSLHLVEISQIARIADQWTGITMTPVLTERNSRTESYKNEQSQWTKDID